VEAGLLGPTLAQHRGRLQTAIGWAADRLQAGQQLVAVAPGGLGPGSVPAGQGSLGRAGGGGQAEGEQPRGGVLLAATVQCRQPLADRRPRLVVAALPQRQPRPDAGQLVGPLGVKLGPAGRGRHGLGLPEPAAGGRGVAAGDLELGPVEP
jgi:hypothetical protein